LTGSASVGQRTAIAVAVGLGLSGPAVAADDPLYPAAQCAALYLGVEDYARISAYLDPDPLNAEAAAAFRDVALRLGGSEDEVDAFIAEQRPLMKLMMDGYIYRGDTQSQDLFERLSETCRDFAERHPETRDLD